MKTLRDVAAEAGVSLGTVSRVINQEPNVAPELVRRVEDAIERLDYEPNKLARNLRRQRSGILGIVVPDITAPFFAELVKWIERAALDKGYMIVVGNSSNSREVEETYLSRLTERGVDGLIVSTSTDLDQLRIRKDAAIVAVDRELPGFDLVASRHESGARKAVSHLQALGHRRIACISGPSQISVFADRQSGYRALTELAFAEQDLDVDGYIRKEPLDALTGEESALSLLEMANPPTAIFATSDQQAIGALSACVDLGLRVPDDISVVGFDDIPLAKVINPRLTTVQQPIELIGTTALEVLLLRLESPNEPPAKHLLDTSLQIRESTGPAPPG